MKRFSLLPALTWLVALLVVSPIVAIGYSALSADTAVFHSLLDTVLPIYAKNSLLLAAGVVGFAAFFALPCAWLLARYQFFSASFLQWALVLPLAMPGYIIGFIYTDWFDYAGPIQIALRQWFGWQSIHDYWFPDIRTLTGAMIVLALVLYPYIYLLMRAAFLEQPATMTQAARSLGVTPWQRFWRIHLPMARPALVVGCALVAMEALGDFGTVNYFAVHTLTTAVYDAWLGYSQVHAASQIASLMLLAVVLVLALERYSRRQLKVFAKGQAQGSEKQILRGWRQVIALLWCWGLLAAAFIFPVLQLVDYSWQYWQQSWNDDFAQISWHSFSLSIYAALVALILALAVNVYHRLYATKPRSVWPMRLASFGYAVPGTVLAIGILLPAGALQHWVNDQWVALGYRPLGLFISGTIAALVIAFVIRFAAVAIGAIESGYSKLSPSLDMAAKTMGCHGLTLFWRVHLPLLKRSLLVATMLVFIESMKELNAALILAPFNFNTLATHVYHYVSDDQLYIAALPALLLVAVGLIPLIWLNRSLERA